MTRSAEDTSLSVYNSSSDLWENLSSRLDRKNVIIANKGNIVSTDRRNDLIFQLYMRYIYILIL